MRRQALPKGKVTAVVGFAAMSIFENLLRWQQAKYPDENIGLAICSETARLNCPGSVEVIPCHYSTADETVERIADAVCNYGAFFMVFCEKDPKLARLHTLSRVIGALAGIASSTNCRIVYHVPSPPELCGQLLEEDPPPMIADMLVPDNVFQHYSTEPFLGSWIPVRFESR